MKKPLKITLTLSITIIMLLGFALPLNPPAGNWYQQFMPNIGSQQINDIYFIDSLTGFAVSSRNVNPDTASILKTTNSGDNWQVVFTAAPKRFSRVKFINATTGFVCGGSGGGTPQFYKTINGGINWNLISSSGCALWSDMYVLNEDTIWLIDANSLCGGVFFTSNGGSSWQQQLNIGSQNPDHIYMVNGRIGFICEDNDYLRRTTNSGINWIVIPSMDGFLDMCFTDTLTGWKCIYGDLSIRKTTDGGLSWVSQIIPKGGILTTSQVTRLSLINKDTIWGTGGQANINGSGRGVIYRTINGGLNWKFQIPDTNFGIGAYGWIQFINNNTGWATGRLFNLPTYSSIHTTNGGDTTFLTGLLQISNEVPKEFLLYQNYPNPFNPKTVIKYQILEYSGVKLSVFDVTGKHIIDLTDQKQSAGTYAVDFSGNGYSSGVYFYQLTVASGKEVFTETKRMLIIK